MIYDDLINCVVVFLVMLVYMLEDFFRNRLLLKTFFGKSSNYSFAMAGEETWKLAFSQNEAPPKSCSLDIIFRLKSGDFFGYGLFSETLQEVNLVIFVSLRQI